MTHPYRVDWAASSSRLVAAATSDAGWYAAVAAELVRPSDGTAVDVGCGGAGMTAALAAALGQSGQVLAVDGDSDILAAAGAHLATVLPADAATIQLVQADLDGGVERLRAVLAQPADLIWASASVHHLADQQAAITALASLLGPGGQLALAEGGLPARHLPWDVGVGEPGLELRLDAAQDRWFARMRAALPSSTRMPYGWTQALRRAGLAQVTTTSRLIHSPAPLPGDDQARVLDDLTHRVDRLRPTGLLDRADLATWDRLLDPTDPAWLGRRTDLYWLEARSVHLGTTADPHRQPGH
jgi:SAM-dependent methyltransferase